MRLKLKLREMLLLGLLAVAVIVMLWQPFSQKGSAPSALSGSRPDAPLSPVSRIDLARLEEPPTEIEIGRRDLFAYGALGRSAEAAEPVEAAPPPPQTDRPPAADPSGSLASRSGPGLPPLNLKFIGSVGNARGVKVAVLVTERNEVLTGQPGEVIANRYRIESIGIESVDLEDVSSGQSRRIPLKGN